MQEVEELAIRLAHYFARRVDAEDVEELVQETLVRALDSLSSWDQARGTFVQFVFGSVARGALRDYRRERAGRARLAADLEPRRERQADAELDRRVAFAQLRAMAAGDPIVMLMLERLEGVDGSVAELWRALEISPRELHNARRRLARLIDKLRVD